MHVLHVLQILHVMHVLHIRIFGFGFLISALGFSIRENLKFLFSSCYLAPYSLALNEYLLVFPHDV